MERGGGKEPGCCVAEDAVFAGGGIRYSISSGTTMLCFVIINWESDEGNIELGGEREEVTGRRAE